MNHSLKNLRHIDAEKVERYLREAGVPASNSHTARATALIHPVDDALALSGLTSEDLTHIDEALSERQKSLNLSVEMGIGMAAIGIVGSVGVVELFIKAGGRLGDIVLNNLDTLFTETTLHLLQNGMFEVALNLPGGTMALAHGVVNLAAHPGEIMDAVSSTMEYGTHFVDALDAAGLGAHALEVVEAASTVLLSVLLSIGARAYIKHKYAPMLKERENRLESERSKYLNLMKLRSALKSKLPARIVAIQLANVQRSQWGF